MLARDVVRQGLHGEVQVKYGAWDTPWYKDWMVWGVILLCGLMISLVIGLVFFNTTDERKAACKGQVLEVQDGRGGWVCVPHAEAP